MDQAHPRHSSRMQVWKVGKKDMGTNGGSVISVSHDLTCTYGDDDDASPVAYELNGHEATLAEILWELCASLGADRHRRSVEWDKHYDPDAPPPMAMGGPVSVYLDLRPHTMAIAVDADSKVLLIAREASSDDAVL